MKSIDIMVEEHENVRRMLKVIRKVLLQGALLDEDIDYDDFYKIINFIRDYMRGHHHSKEEDRLLFKMMGRRNPKN